ncbi:unnamed protein product [Discosporangium mesarthrocarpum]
MKSLKRAGKGGLPGAAAGLLQVLTLMWLRTIVNYQCRYGTSIGTAMSELYRQGGVLRFYRGVVFAILQNPLSRFGLTAANEGALALAEALPNYVPIAVTTWVASIVAGLWRMFLGPLDTCKTVLQVDGPEGFALLIRKVRSGNVLCLYNGAFAAAAATAVGHFPWFLTFNYLSKWIPTQSILWRYIMRNAVIGLAASIISDLVSNSIRVLKTTKQAGAAYETAMSYRAALALVLEADGWREGGSARVYWRTVCSPCSSQLCGGTCTKGMLWGGGKEKLLWGWETKQKARHRVRQAEFKLAEALQKGFTGEPTVACTPRHSNPNLDWERKTL